jgi:hypothetical protein
VQHLPIQVDGMPQIQQESGLSFQPHFFSPEAIQSLLRNQEKPCQLLEEHPKINTDVSGAAELTAGR